MAAGPAIIPTEECIVGCGQGFSPCDGVIRPVSPTFARLYGSDFQKVRFQNFWQLVLLDGNSFSGPCLRW